MSTDQIHPEHLLDRAREGSLDPGEQSLLDSHLGECPSCRFELSLAPALYTHVKLMPGDDVLIRRAITKTGIAHRYERRRPARRAIPAVALVVALLAGAAMASAGAYVWRQHTVTRVEAPASAARPRVVARDAEKPVAGAPAPAAADEIEPLPPRTSPAPVRSRAARAEPPRKVATATAAAEGCADRFRRANELRRDGATRDAVRVYQGLQRSCPGTSEELSSRVLVGRIYLDRLADPARALDAFDGYLASRSNGALREDALIGRALALGKLARAAEEASAWQALLAAFPDSLYSEQARARLNRGK